MKKLLPCLVLVAVALASCDKDDSDSPSSTGTGNNGNTTGVPDCLGIPGGPAVVGSACNDNNTATVNDVYNANCVCIGQLVSLTAPQLIAPPNGVQGIWSPITFSWDAVPGAYCYEARAWYYSSSGTQQTFGLLSLPCLLTTSYTSTASLGALTSSNAWRGKTIYWHVRACSSNPGLGGACGPWSATFSFILAS